MATSPFKAGGPLTDDHAGVYISRKADQDAIEHLLAMDYLLLVEPRQQGKTSLIHHVKGHLALANILLVYIDVTTADHSSEEGWYQTFCPRLLRQMPTVIGHDQWPQPPRNSASWRDFLSEIAAHLTKANQKVVVALDEIGAVTFPGATEFFSVLRDIYNSRPFETEFGCLTFLLSGAFHPRDLIKDDKISPFNIAQRVRLKDFTLVQVQELVSKGSWSPEQVVPLAKRIHYWTDGQPYLTQLLCTYLTLDAESTDVDNGVRRLLREDIIHLSPILNRLRLDNKLHDFVKRILNRENIKFYPTEHRIQATLELIGVIKADESGYCKIRNPIYEFALGAEQQRKLITQILQQKGKVVPNDILQFSIPLAEIVISRYREQPDLSITDADNGIRLTYGADRVQEWNALLIKVSAQISKTGSFRFGSPLVQMCNILAEATGLKLSEQWHTMGNLHATTVVGHGLQLNVPSKFPVIFVTIPVLNDNIASDLVKICQALETRFFSLVIPFIPVSAGKKSVDINGFKGSLRDSPYSDEFVVLAPIDIFSILSSSSPATQLSHFIVTQVSPLAISPFVVGVPVTENMFFGRVRDIRTITQGVALRSFAIVGNRRIGKSSLLRKLDVRMTKDGVIFCKLLNLLAVNDYPSLYRYIMSRDKTLVLDIDRDPKDNFRIWVEHLAFSAASRPLVILVDEVDALLHYDESQGHQLSNIWRRLSEDGQCQFVLAGHRVLAHLLRDSQSPFQNFGEPIELGFLDRTESNRLLKVPLQDLGISLVDEKLILDLVWKVSAGHPQVIQFIGRELLKQLSHEEQRSISLAHLQSVLQSREFINDYLDTIWGGNEPSERTGLSPIERSLLLLGSSDSFTEDNINHILNDAGFRCSAKDVHSALDMLTTFGLLSKSGLIYSSTVPYFIELFRRTEHIEYWLALLQEEVNK